MKIIANYLIKQHSIEAWSVISTHRIETKSADKRFSWVKNKDRNLFKHLIYLIYSTNN